MLSCKVYTKRCKSIELNAADVTFEDFAIFFMGYHMEFDVSPFGELLTANVARMHFARMPEANTNLIQLSGHTMQQWTTENVEHLQSLV